MPFKIWLALDREDIIETYEALCSLPFTKSSISECEPATKRDHGIEYLIEQLKRYIGDDE